MLLTDWSGRAQAIHTKRAAGRTEIEMARKNETTMKAQVLAENELSNVSGGATSQPHHEAPGVSASIVMSGLASDYQPGSAWNLFFAAAAVA